MAHVAHLVFLGKRHISMLLDLYQFLFGAIRSAFKSFHQNNIAGFYNNPISLTRFCMFPNNSLSELGIKVSTGHVKYGLVLSIS